MRRTPGSPSRALTLAAAGAATAVLQLLNDYFSVLGVRAQTGRLFTDADDRNGAPPVVVISDAFWQRRFSA